MPFLFEVMQQTKTLTVNTVTNRKKREGVKYYMEKCCQILFYNQYSIAKHMDCRTRMLKMPWKALLRDCKQYLGYVGFLLAGGRMVWIFLVEQLRDFSFVFSPHLSHIYFGFTLLDLLQKKDQIVRNDHHDQLVVHRANISSFENT